MAIYDPKRGLIPGNHLEGRIPERGDIVVAYGGSYVVECRDDYGCFVCRNMDESCLYSDELRTFDDLDIDEVIDQNDPRFTASGEGI